MALLRKTGSTRAWRRLRAVILARDGHVCQIPDYTPDGEICGAPATHVDHIVQRWAGGTDAPANLRAACAPCNLKRGGRLDPYAPPSRKW